VGNTVAITDGNSHLATTNYDANNQPLATTAARTPRPNRMFGLL